MTYEFAPPLLVDTSLLERLDDRVAKGVAALPRIAETAVQVLVDGFARRIAEPVQAPCSQVRKDQAVSSDISNVHYVVQQPQLQNSGMKWNGSAGVLGLDRSAIEVVVDADTMYAVNDYEIVGRQLAGLAKS